MPERPAAIDTSPFPPTVRRLLLVVASLTLASLCWFLLDEGDSVNAQNLAPHQLGSTTLGAGSLGAGSLGTAPHAGLEAPAAEPAPRLR